MRPALGFAAASAGRVLLAMFTSSWSGDWRRTWLIHHITIRAMDPAALAHFYIDVYGFKEKRRRRKIPISI